MPAQTKSRGWRRYQPRKDKPGPIEAVLQEPLEARKVRCHLCAFRCIIHPGHVGVCSVRQNIDGTLFALNHRKTVALQADPVEKKPLHHFHPGSTTLSLAAPGCNFHCRFCQNSDISQMPSDANRIEGRNLEPASVVDRAVALGCGAIACTYTEPTVFMESALEIGPLAKERGLKNIWVTNGYMTEEAIDLIAPWVDAVNIDLKGMDDRFTLKVCGARHAPICEAIRSFSRRGIWTEVSTVVIPGGNDSEDNLRASAAFLAAMSPDIPWHVAAFTPRYRMRDVPATPPDEVRRARRIGLEEGLRYVYTGNIDDAAGSTTWCPSCGAAAIERSGYRVTEWRLADGKCAGCGTVIAGVGLTPAPGAPACPVPDGYCG